MPINLTDSLLPTLLVDLKETFKTNRINLNLSKVPVVAEAALRKQTAMIRPTFLGAGQGQRCTGFTAWYHSPSSTTIPTATGTAPAASCEIPAGLLQNTDKVDYDFDLFIRQNFTVEGVYCNNADTFRNNFSANLANAMQNIALSLNAEILARFQANVGTPTYAGTTGTIVGTTIEIPTADWTEDLMADLDSIATMEYLAGDYFFLHGQNFKNAIWNAPYKAANDDQRSGALIFGVNEHYFDLREFIAAGVADHSYMIDPNVYAFFGFQAYSETPEETGDQYGTQHFSLPLTYFARGIDGNFTPTTMMHMVDGIMRPVMVNVRRQRKCDATNNIYGKPTTGEFYEVDLVGGFAVAPSASSKTGIIDLVKV